VRTGEIAEMRCERSPLEVREHAAYGITPAGIHGLAQRAVGPDEDGGSDEELRHIDIERGPRRTQGRGRQVDQHRALVEHKDVARIEATVRNARLMKPRSLLPEGCECLVAHLVRGGPLERLDVRLTRDHERVSVGPERSRDHLGHSNSRLRGHQRRQRLVLDLLQAPIRHAPRRIAVGQRTPAAGEPLGVLRIAAEHPHLQLSAAAVVSHIFHGAAPLPCRGPQLGDFDAERRQGAAHVLRGRKAFGCTER
jgi:hypothetical protein